MNSAVVNEITLIVENICVSEPVEPSPYQGMFMVGLQSAVYDNQTTVQTTSYPAGTTVTVNSDASVTLAFSDGTTQSFPPGTTVVTNADGTVNVTILVTNSVLITPATPCDIGWIYDPVTQTFSAP